MLRDATLLRLGKRNALRYADPWSPDRKRAAGLKPGSPGLRAVRRFYGGASGGGAAALSQRNAGADFYFQNHSQVYILEVFFPPKDDSLLGSLNCGNRAQGSVSEVRSSGSRPRGLPAAPPGAGGDFYLQNHAQVSISEVPGPGSRPRGLPAAPGPGSRPRGLPAAPPGAGGDFYFQNHAQVSISEEPGPGSRPVACRRRLRAPAETFISKTMLRCVFRRCLVPVLAPVACRRPPRRLRPVILMGKHSTLATRDVTFPIVLRIPIYIDGETRHFGDIGRRFFDSVVISGGRGHDFDGKTRHFDDIGRRFLGSVVNSDGK